MIAALSAALMVLSAPAGNPAERGETVTLSVALPAGGIRPGSSARVTLLVTVAKGWHINSASPPDSELVATTVAATPPAGLTVSGVRFPPAERKTFSFSSDPLEVYEGTVTVSLEISASVGTAPGEYAIPLEISYQACDNNVCLPPASVRTTATVRVISP